MTFPEAVELLEYWRECPPEAEFLALFARVYTSWEPNSRASMTEEEVQAEHRAELERKWKHGIAVSPKQMLEVLGGRGGSIGNDGIYRGADGQPIPGAHKHPGMH